MGRHQRAGDTDEAVELQASPENESLREKKEADRMLSKDGGSVSRLIPREATEKARDKKKFRNNSLRIRPRRQTLGTRG